MLRLTDFGAKLNGVNPDDDALAAAIQEAKYGGKSCVIGWFGALNLTRQPPPLDRVTLKGDDIYGATVLKNYGGGILFDFRNGRPGFSGGGLENFSVGGSGMAGSYLVLARGDANYQPHGLKLKDLYLGAGAFRCVEMVGYGSLGIRQARVENVTCFGTSAPYNFYATNCVDLHIETLRVYPAGGTYGSIFAEYAYNPGLVVQP